MAGVTTLTYVDYSGERSSVQVHNPDLDITNVETFISPLVTAALGDFKIAVDALTLMNTEKVTVQAIQIPSPATLPTDKNAQREQKLLVKYVDLVTSKKYYFTIPGVDRDLVAQAGTDVVDISSNVYMLALIAAFEANYVSELGNAVSVYGASLVGRNN